MTNTRITPCVSSAVFSIPYGSPDPGLLREKVGGSFQSEEATLLVRPGLLLSVRDRALVGHLFRGIGGPPMFHHPSEVESMMEHSVHLVVRAPAKRGVGSFGSPEHTSGWCEHKWMALDLNLQGLLR